MLIVFSPRPGRRRVFTPLHPCCCLGNTSMIGCCCTST
ncbi:hypothetical protein BN2497_2103 [Janthinobacterium sp. CG23_2]|nr:hypothetical protein BN2497_2103 [Janthinobacterium sp. CG23_2]CUU27449.1 hypothetical protein BN3177_2103 [Janthinobacterium sp. CG23_2]